MTGAKIVIHEPEADMGLGIRTLAPSPNAKMLACGIYDTNLTIYNTCTQVQICELNHKVSVQLECSRANTSQPDIFKEELNRSEGRA